MAFRTGKTDITPRRGTNTYIILAEQEGWDKPDAGTNAADGANWPSYDMDESYIDTEAGHHRRPYLYQPQSDNIGIVRQGTTINSPYYKGSPIHAKEKEGPAAVAGDFRFNITGVGTGSMFRSMLQDKNPVAARVNATTTMDIVASTSITGNTALTIADDLTGTFAPVQISITLSSAARVTANETGTFTIVGENRWGDRESVDLSWTPEELSTPASQTLTKTTQMFWAEVTSITPNGSFSAGTGEVQYEAPPTTTVVASSTDNLASTDDLISTPVTISTTSSQAIYASLSSSADITAGESTGFIFITGTDTHGNAIRDKIRYLNDSNNLGLIKRTTSYFATVTSVVTEGFDDGEVTLQAVDLATNVTFTPSIELPVFLTAEISKGGSVVDTYRNVIIESSVINFSREEPVRAVCTVLGGRAHLGQNTHGGVGVTNRRKLIYAAEVFAGWEASISALSTAGPAGRIEFAVQSATLTINHNIAASGLLGGKYETSPPTGDDEREIMLTIEAQVDETNDYRAIYDANETFDAVRVELRNQSHGAHEDVIQFELPLVQLVEDPDFIVDAFGIIGQTLTMRAIEESELDYEFRIFAQYPEFYPLYVYN